MAVGLITNFPYYVGLGRYAFELFSNLKKMTDVKLVYCNDDGQDSLGDINIKGVGFPAFKKSMNAYFIYPKKIPNFELYHITNQFLAMAAKFNKPSIVSALDLFFTNTKTSKSSPFLSKLLMKNALGQLKSAERIITISKSAKQNLIETLKLDGDKIDVTYLGVNLEKFKAADKNASRKKLKLPSDKKIIFNIGSESDYRKNAVTVVKAFNEALKEESDLFLVRAGKLDSRIDELANSFGIQNKMIRIPLIDDSLLPLYYAAADMYITMDLESGFNLPVLESMACGTPTICSNNDQATEITRDSSLYSDPLNVSEIKEKILMLAGNEDLRAKMIASGQKLVQNFTWEKTARETFDIYKKIVNLQ